MTSKLKCPVCNVPLTACGDLLSCPNDHCAWVGNAELWHALIQAKQDLARKALEEMQHWLGAIRCSMVSHLNNQNNTLLEHYETDPTVQNIDKAKSMLKQYLEQIEHKE